MRALFLSILVTLAACDGKDTDSGTNDTGDAPAFAPSEGDWDAIGFSTSDDGCELFVDGEFDHTTDDNLALVGLDTATGTFTWDTDSSAEDDWSSPEHDCTLSDQDYSCTEATFTGELDPTGLPGVTFEVTAGLSGSFTSEGEASLDHTTVIDCISGCEPLEQKLPDFFPCTTVYSVDAEFEG